VSKYATIAERYWTTFLPSRVEASEDPTALFESLGEQVQSLIDAQSPAAMEMVKAENPDATYPELRSLLRNVLTTLESDALRDVVMLPPEPGTEDKRMPGTVLAGWEQ